MDIPCKQGIYLLTNLVNGKIYIGKSINLYRRMQKYKSEAKHNKNQNRYLLKAIRKYGWENFEVSILESYNEIDNEKLLDREEYWIRKLNTTDRKIGYNIVFRGTDWTGLHHTEKTKQKLSKMFSDGRFSGSHNPMWGRKHSKKTKKKISDRHKGKGKKPVKQINKKTGEIIKIWDSAKEAAISLKGSSKNHASSITKVCSGYIQKGKFCCKSAYGFKWEYA
jgi:group I intron endonuclease